MLLKIKLTLQTDSSEAKSGVNPTDAMARWKGCDSSCKVTRVRVPTSALLTLLTSQKKKVCCLGHMDLNGYGFLHPTSNLLEIVNDFEI